MRIIETRSAEETLRCAEEIAENARPGQVYALIGDLGAGKTVFAQGFARGLGVDDYVNSPTFTILQIYEDGRIPFYHFDVYRIEESEEMEEVGFDWAFMFAYSERPGTLAQRKYPDDVPPEVKNRRLNEIIALQNRKSLERYRAMIGKRVRVLVEGPSKRNPEQLCGRASNNMMCVFPAEGRRAGTFAEVTVEDCTSATLICK